MGDLPPTIPFKDRFLFLEVPSLSPSPPNPMDHLSIQLENFPILLPSSSDYCEDDPPIFQYIHEKLRSAFVKIKVEYGGLIQFWKPVNINGRCLLTTSDQPFILSSNQEGVKEYRSCCEKYKYNIDKVQVEVEEDPTIISTGAPATAFRNQLPEFPTGRIFHKTSPLASSALQCGLKYSFVMPVFYPYLSSCVGVVEYWCGWWPAKLVKLFNELSVALEKVGFKTFDARERLPHKSICGLQNAKDEIDDALMIISEALHLDLSQVWIAYEDEYLSSSLQDTTRTKRMLWHKLTSSHYNECSKGYEEVFYRVPMKMDQVFAGKTIKNYEPLFIRNTLKLNGDEPQRLFYVYVSYYCSFSCFMICLRNTKTGELDYVFEFLWRETQRNDNIFELLLLSLKRHLPSFKFASGVKLGDELRILDAQASTESETEYIKIFQTNQLSPASVTPKSVSVTPKRVRRPPEDEEYLTPLKAKCKTAKKEISREQIEVEFGKTQKEAAQNLNVSLSTLKRKCKAEGIHEWPGKDYSKENVNYLCKNTQRNSNEEEEEEEEEEDNGGAIQDSLANIQETSLGENMLTIKAEYADDTIKFSLPISSATFVAVEKEISEEFKLNPSDYKVKYRDEAGDWILLSSDKAMSECIRNHRNFNITPINMKVLLRKI